MMLVFVWILWMMMIMILLMLMRKSISIGKHFIGAMEQDCMAEFYYADLADWPLGDASIPRNGVLQIPDGPGLGVHVNEDIVAKYRVA